jgi:chromosome segregation protein
VEDRAVVGRILAAVPEDVRLVTLTGEVHHPSGLVELPGQAALSLMNFEESMEASESLIHQTGLEVEQLERAIETLREEEEELSSAIDNRTADLDQTQRTLSKTEQELLQARLEVRGLEDEIERLQTRASEISFQIESCQAGIDSLLAKLPSFSVQLNAEALDLADADVLLAELDSVGELDVIRAGLEKIKKRSQDHMRRVELIKTELGVRDGRLKANRSERTSLTNQNEALTIELQRSESQLENFLEDQRQVEDRLTETVEQRSRLEAEESSGLVELHHAEQKNTELQIALAKIREEMHNLEQRIIDDFGLVTFDEDDAAMTQAPLPLAGLVQHLDRVHTLPPEHELQMNRLRAQLRRMGAVNPEAQQEFQEVRDRVEFLQSQTEDLEGAEKKLHRVVQELDALMAQEFEKTFEAVTIEFKKAFQRLFQGGSANLVLQKGEDLSTTGIDIEVRLPGRREQGLAMLSGGERSLTAAALIFALLKVSPTPFCVLDEVDAMLDESNVLRFGEMLQELSEETQFCVITHNRLTIQYADVIYGVSIGTDSASKVISLKLDEVERELLGEN